MAGRTFVNARSLFRWTTLVLASLVAGAVAGRDSAPGGQEWKYDVVHRKNGPPLCGLVEKQTSTTVQLRCVSRKPGSPTITYTVELPAADIERIDRLPDPQHQELRQRLDAVLQEHRTLAEHLQSLDGGKASKVSAEVVELKPAAWIAGPTTTGLEYRSTHFRLLSNARPEVVTLAAIQLEQVYGAYVRLLPPRMAGAPTVIVLTGSQAEYQELVRDRGLNLSNPAFYDAGRNQVVCASDLQRLADDLARARQHHAQLSGQLAQREAELKEAYRGPIPAEIRAPVDEARTRIKAAEARNAEVFRRARDRLFQRLYHEAFHAYLANFVYAPTQTTVPRWLNEGLAQVFESALVEAGELRIDHADPERLAALRPALAQDTLVPLPELLRAGPELFQVAHAAGQQASDRYYLASWALTFHLVFQRQFLGKRMDAYVSTLHRGTDPVEAFRELVGEPLTTFEKNYRHYLQHLKADGHAGQAGGVPLDGLSPKIDVQRINRGTG
jgi:hypothetical protein